MLTPESIIRTSRELEPGDPFDIPVDLDPSHGQLIEMLDELAGLIRAAERGSLAQAQLIKRYNELLFYFDNTLYFHGTPLPKSARIDDAFTFIDYLYFEDNFRREGPFTLEKLWSMWSVVAHIHVSRRKWLNLGQMTVRCLRAYKGTLPAISKISHETRRVCFLGQ